MVVTRTSLGPAHSDAPHDFDARADGAALRFLPAAAFKAPTVTYDHYDNIATPERLGPLKDDERRRVSNTYTWSDALAEAHDELGYTPTGVDTPRTVGGIRAALRPDRLSVFEEELSGLSDGGYFEVFLDNWWTQALADAAPDEQAREAAIDFADLSVAHRISHAGGPTMTGEEVNAMLAAMDEEQAR